MLLNAVVDSLDVRVFRRIAPSLRLYQDAEVWRLYMEQFEPGVDGPLYVQFPGCGTFKVHPSGRAPYQFVLSNPQIADVRIWNLGRWHSKSCSQTGQFYISFRSVFLQQFGIEGARRFIANLLDQLSGPCPDVAFPPEALEFDRISRVDLAADVQHDPLVWADLDAHVCRARKIDTWEHVTPAHIEDMIKMSLSAGQYLPMDAPEAPDALLKATSQVLHAFTKEAASELATYGEADCSRVVTDSRTPQTVYFGRFGSKLYARRYNKSGSLVVQNKMYMLDVWLKNGWDAVSPVWRTEFSMSGDFLKEYQVPGVDDCRSLDDLEAFIPPLWEYLTSTWLRHVDLSTDTRPERCQASASWSLVQGAFPASELVGHRDTQQRVPRGDAHLIAQARGCSVSAVALRAVAQGSIEAGMQSVVDDYIYRFDDDFIHDVKQRMDDFGLDDFTDTVLSTEFRREKMLDKTGS